MFPRVEVGALLLGFLLAAGPVAAAPVSSVAACRAQAGAEALTDGSFDLVAWDKDGKPSSVRRVKLESGRTVRRVEAEGRLHAANMSFGNMLSGDEGWTRFHARCDYAKGHEIALSLDIERQLPTRLDLNPPRVAEIYSSSSEIRPEPPPTAPPPAAGPSASANLPIRKLFEVMNPTLTEVPYGLPVTRRQEDFMYNHQFGFKLNTPF